MQNKPFSLKKKACRIIFYLFLFENTVGFYSVLSKLLKRKYRKKHIIKAHKLCRFWHNTAKIRMLHVE